IDEFTLDLKKLVKKLGKSININTDKPKEAKIVRNISTSSALSLNIFSIQLGESSCAGSSTSSKNSAENIKDLKPIIIDSIKPTTPLIKGNPKNLFFIAKVFNSFISNSISLSGFLTAIDNFFGPLIITPSIRA